MLRGNKPLADVIRMDLAKAARVSKYGPDFREAFAIPHPTNHTGLEESVRSAIQWMDHWINSKCTVAADIETSSLDFFNCKLYSIGLSGEDRHSVGVAFTLGDLHTLPWQAEQALVSKLRELLKGNPLLFHNAPFDVPILRLRGFDVSNNIEDTQGLHQIVQPDLYHTLDWIAHTYLDTQPWKLDYSGSKQVFTRDIMTLLVYNARDAINTCKLRHKLYEDIYDRGMSAELIRWQNEFAKLAIDMEVWGLPINMAKRNSMGQALLNSIEKLKYEMRQELRWPDFNPMNKNHAIIALYDKKYIGLVPKAWTKKTRVPSTKADDLMHYMGNPFVKKFVTYVENHHVYAGQYRNPPTTPGGPKAGKYYRAIKADGRLHPQWNPTGQKGSRFSSRPNVQNQRKKDREFFEAPEGKVFIGSDKDQLELRLAAVFAGVRELLEEMAKPDGDPHRLAAVNVYGEAFLNKSAAEQKKLRDAVKTTVYASLYRAGVKTVHRSIHSKKWLPPSLRATLTENAVAHIYHSYFGKYSEIPAWHDSNYEFVSNYGYIEIPPLGRRRYFPVLPAPYTEVANWPIQTAGSDIVGKEMVEVQYELKRRFDGASIVLHGHDALYIECYTRHVEDILKLVNKLFGHTLLDGPAGPVELTSEAKVCRNLAFKKEDILRTN
jgi:DNA polymerase-1